MKLKLPFGLKDGKIVDINEVERGLDCKCVCPSCKHPLVARKGEERIDHFAHYKQPECKYAIETALHMAAKEYLETYKEIRLPEVIAEIGRGYDNKYRLYPSQVISFNKVRLEHKTNNIIPDVIIEKNGRKMLIEIAVTHFIDKKKKEKIKKLGISTLEIDLSHLKEDFDKSQLKYYLDESVEYKKWIYNQRLDQFMKEISTGAMKKAVYRGQGYDYYVPNCPISKKTINNRPYANVEQDCIHCLHYWDAYYHEEHGYIEYIQCNGHRAQEINPTISNLTKLDPKF